ncbi:MAG: hypothetical protein NNA18_10155 [Nitrospira sp.]|nr:hypothetical protein [Nitrospira sp.]
MFKFFFLLLLLAASFAAGYYVGQRPVGSLEKTVSDLSKRLTASEKLVGTISQSVKNLSQGAAETVTTIERDIRRRQGLIEAQSQVAEAHTEMLERNYGEAAKKLAEAINAAEQSAQATRHPIEVDTLRALATSLREARLELAKGRPVPTKKFDDWQQTLDTLLNKT